MNTAEQLNFNGALLELLSGLATVPDPAHQAVNVVVTGIQLDSRMLRKGDLFLACFGRNHDAREFIGEGDKNWRYRCVGGDRWSVAGHADH